MVEFRVLMKLLTIVVLDSVRGRGRGPLLLQLSLDGVMGSFQSSRSFPYPTRRVEQRRKRYRTLGEGVPR